MRHRYAGGLFNRNANQRKALFRSLMKSLIEHERIETTLAKAKETRRLTERLVTLGKRGDLQAKRLVFSKLPHRGAVAKLFSDIAPRFEDRNGGYLRIIKTRQRLNDRSQMAVIEFIDFEQRREASESKETKKK